MTDLEDTVDYGEHQCRMTKVFKGALISTPVSVNPYCARCNLPWPCPTAFQIQINVGRQQGPAAPGE